MNLHRTFVRSALLVLIGAGLSSCDLAGDEGGPGPSPGILGAIPEPPGPPFAAPTNTRVTIGNFQQPNGYCYYSSMSSTGRYCAFSSSATNLVPGDTNGTEDIYVRDRDYDDGSATPDGIFDQPDTGTKVVRVSIASDGSQSNSYSFGGMISADGRFVVFTSYANNLVGSDTNNAYDTFVHDRDWDNGSATPNGVFDESGTGVRTTRVSVSTGNVQATGDSYEASISATGRFVTWYAYAPNLVAGDTNGTYDVFLRDRDTDNDLVYDEAGAVSTVRVSIEHPSNPDGILDGNNTNGYSYSPSISYDGRFVAFVSSASDLLSAGVDSNNYTDIYVWDRLAPAACSRISVGPGGVQTNNYSYLIGNNCVSSGGGLRIVFYSYANNLIAAGQDTNNTYDAFMWSGGVVSRVSVGDVGQQGNNSSYPTSISDNGNLVVFSSGANNLVSGDNNGFNYDVYVRNISAGTTKMVSRDANLNSLNGYSDVGYISGNGLYVSFYSDASNVIADDLNNYPDIFVKTLSDDAVIRASQQVGGQPSADCERPSIAANGNFVVFDSTSTNLVSFTTSGRQVFLRDTTSGNTALVSVDSFGNQGAGDSSQASVSSDGRFVAFSSYAANLVPSDFNNSSDIFVRDLVAGVTVRVSGTNANGDSFEPSISADGRLVAFTSFASDLVAGDTNGTSDVFIYNRVSGTTTRVSVATGGVEATGGDSNEPSLSGNGLFVAFRSSATDLVGNDLNGASDVFVHEIAGAVTTRVSVANGGTEATGDSSEPSISSDGQIVAFTSTAPDLGGTDANDGLVTVDGRKDVFFHDRSNGQTTRVTSGDDGSLDARVSGNGRYLVFASDATDLLGAGNDTNGWRDIFIFDRQSSTTLNRVSITGAGGESNRESNRPSLTATGQFVVYESNASNLVPNDTTTLADIILRGPLN